MFLSNTKRYLNWLGSSLGVVGIIFVAIKLNEYSSQIDKSIFNLEFLISFLGLVIAYCTVNLLLSVAWHDLLKYFDVDTTITWAVETYGITQLAKYVPGNIFHFASRQAIGMANGIPNIPLAKSALWEIFLIILAGSLFVILNLQLFKVEVSEMIRIMIFITVVSTCCSFSYILYGYYIARAILSYTLLLAITGIIFAVVLVMVVPEGNNIYYMVTPICGAYVVAWLIGLLTPGAPAGVGVRELVLFSLLSSSIHQADLLTAITLSRILTVTSDVIFYFIAIYLRRLYS